jgi:hypothetical protein
LEIESKSNTVNLLSKVKALLQSAGFNDVWMYLESVKLNIFIPVLHGRLKDIYITNGILVYIFVLLVEAQDPHFNKIFPARVLSRLWRQRYWQAIILIYIQ